VLTLRFNACVLNAEAWQRRAAMLNIVKSKNNFT